MRKAILLIVAAVLLLAYACVAQTIIVTQPTTTSFPVGTELPIQWSTSKTDQIFSVNIIDVQNNTLYEIVSSTVAYNPSGYSVSKIIAHLITMLIIIIIIYCCCLLIFFTQLYLDRITPPGSYKVRVSTGADTADSATFTVASNPSYVVCTNLFVTKYQFVCFALNHFCIVTFLCIVNYRVTYIYVNIAGSIARLGHCFDCFVLCQLLLPVLCKLLGILFAICWSVSIIH